MIDQEDEEISKMKQLFNQSSHPVYDYSNMKENEPFRRVLISSDRNRSRFSLVTPRPNSRMQLGTASGFQRQPTAIMTPLSSYRQNSAFRPVTGDTNRPMTAVRGAGYTSQNKQVFDPLNQCSGSSSSFELQKDDSPEEKIKIQESKIMALIEESCFASEEGNHRKALEKAKEASNKERNLIRMQEQAGLGDIHNLDLTYSVLFTLANQYAANEMFTEALNTYQLITKNRMFSNAYRLKINMGNIYFKLKQNLKAMKMYRMALDQVPSTQKQLRIKIMHNIAMVYIKMRQWEEAISSLEYIMNEEASHRAGLHLVLCCYAIEDKDKMKAAFSSLLSVPLDLDDDDKYAANQDNPEDVLISTAIRNDDLHLYEIEKRTDAEYCILTSAKLIAPLIGSNFNEGYDWCVATIKNSEYAKLAADLEINKAVMYLKQGHVSEAIETLKTLDNNSTSTRAAANLSFIYYLKGDLKSAEKYGEIVKKLDGFNADGFINLGACAMARNDDNQAKNYFISALECDPSSFEALYNLGLVLKKQGAYEEALKCFQKFTGSLALIPAILYQMAWLFERMGDIEAAAEAYQQFLGLVPTDASILQKVGELYDSEGDKQQANHYLVDSYRYFPSNLAVTDWLGSYFIEMQVIEKALTFFEKAILMQPNEPKWYMMVAGCHRRNGNLHTALDMYQDIHRKFPENTECLKFLIRICKDLGMSEAQQYALELKKIEKSKEVRERIGSSRPVSRRSGSGLSSRAGSGFNSVLESDSSGSRGSGVKRSRLPDLNNSGGSFDSGIGQGSSEYFNAMEKTTPNLRKRLNYDEFGDEQLGDDLLPQ